VRKEKPSRREKFALKKTLGLHKTSSTNGWDEKNKGEFFFASLRHVWEQKK
jgi:hypothetical protein